MTFLPSIDRGVAALAPGFRALSVFAETSGAADPAFSGLALEQACAAIGSGEPAWSEAHLADWAEVFRRFGAKPQRTPCSAEALRRRVLRDGRPPRLDPVVDLYNALSLRYAPRSVPGTAPAAPTSGGPGSLSSRVLDGSERITYHPFTMTQRLLTLSYLYFLAHAGGLDV